MATNAGSVFVNLEARIGKFKQGLNTATSRLKRFSQQTAGFISAHRLAITAGLAGIAVGLAKSVKAYGVQEQAIAGLNQALRNQGMFTEQTTKALQDYAAELQKVTTFGDETIIKAEAMFVAFGFEEESVKTLTKSTLDLAAAKGFDLVTAADLVAKSVGSSTNALTRYGIEVTGAAGSTARAASAVENINKLFGGQAEVLRKTVLGQFQALGNVFGDLQETIGSLIAGEGSSLIEVLTGWILKLDNAIKIIRDFTKEMGGFAETIKRTVILVLGELINFLVRLGGITTGLGPILKLLKIDVDAITIAISNQTEKLQGYINAKIDEGRKFAEVEDKKRTEISETGEVEDTSRKKRLEAEGKAIQFRIDSWMKMNNERIARQEEWNDVFTTSTEEMTKFAQDQIESMFNQFGQGVADMIMEARRFSDVIKSIWKDLARAVIAQIAQMIAKWIAFQILTGGAGGGFGAAGKFFGGMQHGGVIAEPSIVTGLRSGTTRLAGEAGPEAVVPLKGRSSVFGGDQGVESASGPINVTVNVNGNFLEGSKEKWQRLIKETIVPEIRRWSQSNPTGPFQRARGSIT